MPECICFDTGKPMPQCFLKTQANLIAVLLLLNTGPVYLLDTGSLMPHVFIEHR